MEPGQVALATGDSIVGRFAAYGPFAASFLANLLGTVGDKGQLVVVALASRYGARSVFAGSMAAFGLWSAVEVLFGQWLVRALPGGIIAPLTGGLFLAFGLWSLLAGLRREREERLRSEGGVDVGAAGRYLGGGATALGDRGPVATSFVFVLFAEFGDKTQLLTINLAATFPRSPLAVFAGVVLALALRTGLDAVVGDQFERLLPTSRLELLAGAVFVAFGLHVFGVVSTTVLLGVVALAAVLAVASVLRRRER